MKSISHELTPIASEQTLLTLQEMGAVGELVSSNQKPIAAFMLSLLSGLFIVLGGSLWCLWLDGIWSFSWVDSMMHGWDEHMDGWNLGGLALPMGVLSIIFGVATIITAIMLYTNPKQHELLGALIIVFSVVSVLGCLGGFGIGIVLGGIGGILAVLWKPEKID